MEIRQQMLTKNLCYINGKKHIVKGVMWHSTGSNNPNLSRYLPDDGFIGKNEYNNHWDQPRPGGRLVCPHAFIGKDKFGVARVYQTLPFDIESWTSGRGPRGSANQMGFVQFEICEDDLSNKAYFDEVYNLGVQLTAHIVKTYGIEVNAATIIDHSGGYKMGIASNHSDVMHWFKRYGKTMDSVIRDVRAILNPPAVVPPAPKPTYVVMKLGSKGTEVSLLQEKLIKVGYGPADGKADGSYGGYTQAAVRKYQAARKLTVDGIAGPKTQAMLDADIDKLSAHQPFQTYLVRIDTPVLNIRSGPSTSSKDVGNVYQGDVFTIIDEQNGWGKLKSGVGWIFLKLTKRV